ncbi:MAG: hypothetical protein GY927_14145, partial [bacterium]|nr:hypothetical protein [bacterium]
MKTDVRFTPRALIIFTGLLSALFIATSSVVFVHTNTANAQTRSFDQRLVKLKTDIDRLIKKGRYVPALVKAKLYVRLMARKVGTRHPNYARALQLQAKVYRYLKRPAEAQKFEIRAATILKNHAIFIAKQSADIRSARTKANKFEWEMHAKMLRERRAQQQATLPKKRALHSVQKNTAKPGGSYKRKMRTSRTTRSQPKPVMRRKKATSKERTVSKSIAPPAPIATPSPPIALPRSDIGGTSGSTAPADDDASFDLFAESGDEEARSTTPKQPVKTKTSPGAAVAVGNENHTVVKVYFATDRQRTASTKL